jgi:release factor glutamine methyltransferase
VTALAPEGLALDEATPRRAAMARLAEAFAAAGIEDPAQDARLLLCAAAGLDHVALIRDPDLPLEEAADRLAAMARRRIAREPVTRILGERGFWSLDLLVRPGVLDPRPDTETVIDAVLDLFAQRQAAELRMADLGTGSGALACALLDVFPQGHCVALDLSPEACSLARDNLARCGFAGRAEVRQGGWAAAAPGAYDLVVSNPPYIPSAAIDALDPEVRDHDPRLALDGGADGLDAYRQIGALLPGLLAPGGACVLEVGIGQAADVAALLAAAGLRNVATRRDLGGIERVVLARL